MRNFALVLMLPLVPFPAGAGEVLGSVTDLRTGAPIPAARVVLVNATPQRNSSRNLSVTTDSIGQYRIEDVPAGDYLVAFSAPGHRVPPGQKTPRIRLGSDADRVTLNAQLIPNQGLTGHVVDSEDRPVAGISVELSGVRRGGTMLARTNESGHFSFGSVQPGRYYLLARPASVGFDSAGRFGALPAGLPPPRETETRQAWIPTFYPSSPDSASAGVVIVAAGLEPPPLAIRLRAAPVYWLSGRVVSEAGEPVPRAVIRLAPEGRASIPEASTVSDSNGDFSFPSVRSALWRLDAEAKLGSTVLRGYATASLSRAGLSGVELRIAPPFVLRGFVDRSEPRDSPGKRKVTAVTLVPAPGQAVGGASASHQQDGSLLLPRVYPGRYRILPVGFLPGYYVESILLGGQDVTLREVDLGPHSPPFVVNYRPNAGTVRGSVAKGEASTVVLLPKDEARWNMQFIRTAKCGPGGSFDIGSLRPGEYTAYAFDRIDAVALEDPAFNRTLRNGKSVRVEHGQVSTLELAVQPWPEP